ncbi:hypothetical protein TNCV_4320931 [Trichonephila clavipes]|nr:hypothetical protein TNCV_4320931 [Trichonephila clavipes]
MSASARARASQKYKSRLSLKDWAMGHTQVPQCPAPSERDGFGNVAKPTPRGTVLLPPTSRAPRGRGSRVV